MSTDARPTTDPTANGAAPPAADGADPRPDLPRWEEGPDKLPLTIWWREHIRDMRWVEEQFHCGGFDQYVGNHIAVWNERVIAYGPNLAELRERAARESGLPPGNIMTRYVMPAIDE